MKDDEILAELRKLNVALASIAASLAQLANPRYRIGAVGSVQIIGADADLEIDERAQTRRGW